MSTLSKFMLVSNTKSVYFPPHERPYKVARRPQKQDGRLSRAGESVRCALAATPKMGCVWRSARAAGRGSSSRDGDCRSKAQSARREDIRSSGSAEMIAALLILAGCWIVAAAMAAIVVMFAVR